MRARVKGALLPFPLLNPNPSPQGLIEFNNYKEIIRICNENVYR